MSHFALFGVLNLSEWTALHRSRTKTAVTESATRMWDTGTKTGKKKHFGDEGEVKDKHT